MRGQLSVLKTYLLRLCLELPEEAHLKRPSIVMLHEKDIGGGVVGGSTIHRRPGGQGGAGATTSRLELSLCPHHPIALKTIPPQSMAITRST